MKYTLFLFVISLFLPAVHVAQSKVYPKKSTGISKEIGIHFSSTKSGITTGIGINLKKSNHQVGVGVRSVPNYISPAMSKPFGFYTDYRFYTTVKRNAQPFMNAYYGNSFSKTHPINSETKKSLSVTHEIYMGYGVCFKLGKISIAPILLYGGSVEMKRDPYTHLKRTSVKMSYQLKLNVAYDF